MTKASSKTPGDTYASEHDQAVTHWFVSPLNRDTEDGNGRGVEGLAREGKLIGGDLQDSEDSLAGVEIWNQKPPGCDPFAWCYVCSKACHGRMWHSVTSREL